MAVRSSATAEDLPHASFAGQQETFLNVRGERDLLRACRKCLASLFTDRAISYRATQGFDHMKVALSIGVQLMVRSDLGGAGVMFSVDTETGFDRVVVIDAAWGLGENVVKGAVDPDEYQVFKPLLQNLTLKPIVQTTLGGKTLKMGCGRDDCAFTRVLPTSEGERASMIPEISNFPLVPPPPGQGSFSLAVGTYGIDYAALNGLGVAPTGVGPGSIVTCVQLVTYWVDNLNRLRMWRSTPADPGGSAAIAGSGALAGPLPINPAQDAVLAE